MVFPLLVQSRGLTLYLGLPILFVAIDHQIGLPNPDLTAIPHLARFHVTQEPNLPLAPLAPIDKPILQLDHLKHISIPFRFQRRMLRKNFSALLL